VAGGGFYERLVVRERTGREQRARALAHARCPRGISGARSVVKPSTIREGDGTVATLPRPLQIVICLTARELPQRSAILSRARDRPQV